eukprot:TRINITY_DN57326_c0_g1_i1.p2 TRINITY_DN57326_c0_g1~~TRINITY_DN57326_c0_g1_i1.p2  ORF type:complete len:272 (+),score=56.79 TRINITY_DN57326_c0_g1_i1:72-818(+)
MPSGGLSVYVRSPGSEGVRCVEVGPAATVQDLLLAALGSDVVTGDYSLEFQGQVLDPAAALADAGVTSEATVELLRSGLRWGSAGTHYDPKVYRVSPDGCTATKISGGSGVVLADCPPLGEREVRWTVVADVEPGSDLYDVQLGVAKVGPDGISLTSYLDSVAEGWSRRSCGNMFGRAPAERVGDDRGSSAFGIGDRITMCWHGPTGGLQWLKNGQPVGRSFINVPREVVPALTLPRAGNTVTFAPEQ